MEYTLHGLSISDPWFWLEDLDSAETRAWVEKQNQRSAAFLESIPQREEIRQRITELWNYSRRSMPFKEGHLYFDLRNDGLQNQWVLFVRDSLEGTSRVLLDPNTLSSDGTVALVGTEVSLDGKLLAYGLSRSGSDWTEWRVRDVESGVDLVDHIEWVKFSTVSWTPDNKGFFYCRYDAPVSGDEYEGQNVFQKIHYHRIGSPQSADHRIYDRPDHKEWNFNTDVTEDGRYLIIHVWAATNYNLIFYKDLQATTDVIELISRFEANYQFIGNDGPTFWFLTDWDAPLGRVIAVDTSQAGSPVFRTLIPESEHTLNQVTAAGDYFVTSFLANAHTKIKVFARDGGFVRDVELPGIGTVSGFAGHPGDPEVFFDFTGFTQPATVHRYDVSTGVVTELFKPPMKFDPNDFETRQVFYTSRDGTRVSMFIAHKRGLILDGSHPTQLYGYGGFGISITPSFSSARIAWMERGGVFAVPNLRGGGEYGEQWHLAGTKERKQNVFDDFIAAAEWLIDSGYTTQAKLAILGGSNGGLLVAACLIQRPDLFGAAVPTVGVMDMLRFHKFTIGSAWTSDYGSPDDPEEFKHLLAYSPYHNIRAGTAYPPTLITTGDHDDRVVPSHSYKFAA
ncbi:MAG TPA: prolyl oligopeptidase family serine peptidase, partial [Terriglobia bacterium]|nr:prolyl oligopeptidase family serine peptidase [Terriglobia bacterium]